MNMTKQKRQRHPSLEREYRVLFVDDIMEILNIGQTKAYQIIRDLNKEIEAAGYSKPLGGRVSETYFRKRYYLGDSVMTNQMPPGKTGKEKG